MSETGGIGRVETQASECRRLLVELIYLVTVGLSTMKGSPVDSTVLSNHGTLSSTQGALLLCPA
jgi:hypothetical protein